MKISVEVCGDCDDAGCGCVSEKEFETVKECYDGLDISSEKYTDYFGWMKGSRDCEDLRAM